MAGFCELVPDIVRRRISQTRPLIIISHPNREPIRVTYAVLDNAVNRAAWFLEQNLSADEETFIWMSQSDVRYLIWALAAMKTGKAVVFPSLSNRVPANLKLFDTVGAKHMFFGPESAEALGELITQASPAVMARPGLSLLDIVSSEPVEEYAFVEEYEKIKNKRFMGLHTSGTSGHPKPIWWTHGHFECLYSIMHDDGQPGRTRVEGHTFSTIDGHDVLLIGSQSHAGALLLTFGSLRCDSTIIMMHPELPAVPAHITAVLGRTGADSLICPPAPIESMLSDAAGAAALARLRHVGYVGGPMNPALGARLARLTPHLYSCIGTTEGGVAHLDYGAPPTSDRWDALRFVDVGQRMDEVLPGLFELVFPRTPRVERAYAFFRSCPELAAAAEYRTKDLFAPVPGAPGWWRFRGRADNWVALASGLKLDPTDFEAAVAAAPGVRGALVGGAGRARPCLLVEMRDDRAPATAAERRAALDALWPAIRAANRAAPAFGQIARELVLFAPRDKPFLRAAKGTVQRQLTLDAYAAELDALYAAVERGALAGADSDGIAPVADLSAAGLAPLLTQLYRLALDAPDVDADTDVFARGLDSNGVTITIARLKAALRRYIDGGSSAADAGADTLEDTLRHINIGFMYSAPTARALAAKLSALLLGDRGSQNGRTQNGNGEASKADEEEDGGVAEMLRKYLPLATRDGAPHSIVLTGSTGSLGTYLLAALQAQPASRVRRIFCINRAPDARAKQAAALKARGLPPAEDGFASSELYKSNGNGVSEGDEDEDPGAGRPRVVFLTAPDFGAARLGLAAAEYAALRAEATAVIHNAWPVNFLLPLGAFEGSVRGVTRVLELARGGARAPAVFFVSSVAAAMAAAGPVPEAVLADPRGLRLRQGYARSKHVGEALVDAYARATGRPAAVLRVGQVAGPAAPGAPGVWNPSEWFPSLVRSSARALGGVAPSSLGTCSRVEWIPVDALSRIAVEIVLGDSYESGERGEDDGHNARGDADGDEEEEEAEYTGLGVKRPRHSSQPSSKRRRHCDGLRHAGARVYNLVNPTPAPWSDLLPALLETGVVSAAVPFEAWIAALERSSSAAAAGDASPEDNPAAKLLDFYRSLLPRAGAGEDDYVWRVDNVLRASPTARALPPVNREWMKLWLERWGL
ncbi:acetyl-CoA synthetase-like protein [Durotheca rogersii]|uniref:acetyl-CoA synthetase-like protein n=1 Tax=Durotheca rogersii TaxID=419775 RepID=UPI00221FC02B|nr:acetyl-CoA synthetase-like protein [Durotheca rogersii]KAI5867331.1 acetyl-CoA synthetase-like protein [Durotheca rogersii]